MDQLKLTLKRAIFSGKTFLRHTESIASILDKYSDEYLEKFFESSDENFEALEEWDKLRERFGEMSS